MKAWKEATVEKRITAVLWFLLAAEFILLGAANLFFQTQRIDDDSAKLYVHVMEMWKNRALFIPGWSYSTTLEFDCASLLALPLYALTGNIFLAFGISSILFAALFLWVLFQVFYKKSAVYPLLAAVLLFIPYRAGSLDYYNMLFFNGSQYIIKIMLPLLLAAILVRMEEKRRPGKREIVLFTLYGFFLFLSSFSSGAYVFVCGLFPVFAGFLVYKLLSAGKIPAWYWICGGGTVALAAAGIAVNMLMKIGTKGMQMDLIGIMDGSFRENFFSVILGMFELFGGAAYENVPVLSFRGIDILLRMGYVFLLLGCVICMIGKAAKGKGHVRGSMFSAMFVWNLFILLVCNTRYGSLTSEYRYHLMGMVPVICLAAEEFADFWLEKGGRRRVLLTCGGAALYLALLVTSERTFFLYKPEFGMEQFEAIIEYAGGSGAEEVYVFGDVGVPEILRLLDDDGPVYLHLRTLDGNVTAKDYYEQYVDFQGRMDTALIVACSPEWEDIVEMAGYRYRKVLLLENFSLYECVGPVGETGS